MSVVFLRHCGVRAGLCAVALLSSLLSEGPPVLAQPQLSPASDPTLEAELQKIVTTRQIPGLALLVLDTHKTVVQAAAGVRRQGQSAPLQLSDRFHLGSCTKAMTATLLATLVEAGQLRWDSTLGEVFADQNMLPAWKNVTLRHLLTHRAGIPANLMPLQAHIGSLAQRRHALLKAVLASAPLSAPGTDFLYSNTGYTLAGMMAEKVTGQSWETLMQERLFEPLDMTSAGFGPPSEIWGHTAAGKPVNPRSPQADNPALIGPAGTVHARLDDWARFVRLHLQGEKDGWVYQGRTLISPAQFREMHTPVGTEAYAMGWGIAPREWAGGPALSHSGSNTLWYVVAWLAPLKGRAVLVGVNQGTEAAVAAADQAAALGLKGYF
ncbi:MAG: serine hydrolase domain-containing protein [Candidatus Sericytochromatia bacterium]